MYRLYEGSNTFHLCLLPQKQKISVSRGWRVSANRKRLSEKTYLEEVWWGVGYATGKNPVSLFQQYEKKLEKRVTLSMRLYYEAEPARMLCRNRITAEVLSACGTGRSVSLLLQRQITFLSGCEPNWARLQVFRGAWDVKIEAAQSTAWFVKVWYQYLSIAKCDIELINVQHMKNYSCLAKHFCQILAACSQHCMT